MKLILFTIFFTILLIATPAFALKFNPIQPLPGLEESGDVTLSNYLSNVFNTSIGVTAIIAVVMIVIAGLQYTMSFGAPSSKGAARTRINNAIMGLLLVLGAYLFLRTINPDLVTKGLQLEPFPGGGDVVSITSEYVCPDCVNISAGALIAKAPPNGCKVTDVTPTWGTCQVSSSIRGRLYTAHINLTGAGLSYEVTELWPPTTEHKNTCHYNGTCVDLAIRTTRSGGVISRAIREIEYANLFPIYEVQTNTRRDELISQGVPANKIVTIPTINAEHFSVYDSPR